MMRILSTVCLCILLPQVNDQKKEAPAEPEPMTLAREAPSVAAKLSRTKCTLETPVEASLQITLDSLSDKYGLNFILDVQRFKDERQIADVGQQTVRLPKVKDLRLKEV